MVCPECGRSQNVLANRIIWLSGMVGLITFIGSAALFISSSVSLQWARTFGADIQVLNVSSQKTLILFNNSSVDTVIEKVQFKMPGEIELFVIVNQSLSAGGTSNIDLGALFEAQTTGPFREQFARSNTSRQVSKVEISKKKAAEILENLGKGDYGWDKGERYTVEAINKGGADWVFFNRKRSCYVSADCSITISYQVVKGNSFELKPKCVGVVKYLNSSGAN